MASRILYRIEHYGSLPVVALGVGVTLAGLIVTGAFLGFPSGWVVAFEVSVSVVTLLMVFGIQHTQGREQAATQRKLDELLSTCFITGVVDLVATVSTPVAGPGG